MTLSLQNHVNPQNGFRVSFSELSHSLESFCETYAPLMSVCRYHPSPLRGRWREAPDGVSGRQELHWQRDAKRLLESLDAGRREDDGASVLAAFDPAEIEVALA